MNHGLAVELHVNLYVGDSCPLLVYVALDLVMACIELEKVDRSCFFRLPLQELRHEFYLLELPRKLHLVAL